MKKKICFVGFSGEELEPLQPVLGRVAAVWDCLFFPDGPNALVALGAGAVDAVVASAGKNSLDAAEFMHQAATRQPRALRLILGNVVEQELIISCIGATHQFIAKPCKPQDLISTIQRALALDACMSSDQIRALAPKLRRLPSLPSTYFEVLKQVESSSSTVQSVGEVIMRDPALTAKLLQMVNSAAFALAQKVTDPMDAVSLLGMETVRSLVLCLQVFSQNDKAKQSGISLDQLWEHSLRVAEMAREITRFQTHDDLLASEAFTAGLLHDVGRIVIASNLPSEYAETVKFAKGQGRPLHLLEAAQFGVDHAQVGAYLMGLWGMPAALVEATALHHTPSRTPAHEFSLLSAVHVADVFAHEKDRARTDLVQPQLDPNYLSALGLDGKPEVWRKMLSGESVPLKDEAKPKKAEKPIARRVPAAPIVPPLPVEPVKSGWSISNILAPAGLIVGIVTAIFFWQHAYQSDVIVLAKAKPAATNTFVAAPATYAAPTAQFVPVVPKPAPETGLPPTTKLVEIQNPNPNPVALRGFDSVKLGGILFAGTSSSVILNGKTLSVGQRINGVLVEAIDSTSVTLAYKGREKILRVR